MRYPMIQHLLLFPLVTPNCRVHRLLVHECDVFSAQWLSNYGDVAYIPTYADTVSYTHVLESYSTINDTMIFLLSNDY